MIDQTPPPCLICAVRRAVYLVLMADHAGDGPTPDTFDLEHRALDAVAALHRFAAATSDRSAEVRARKAAAALATLFAELTDLAVIHEGEPCDGGHD